MICVSFNKFTKFFGAFKLYFIQISVTVFPCFVSSLKFLYLAPEFHLKILVSLLQCVVVFSLERGLQTMPRFTFRNQIYMVVVFSRIYSFHEINKVLCTILFADTSVKYNASSQFLCKCSLFCTPFRVNGISSMPIFS